MRQFKRLHEDRRGAISVLVLLTIWCLVALIAMIWNTAEYASRRQHVQNAADSAAHASATWMARTLNSVTAQNMVIARDASAEAIWRAAITAGGTAGNPNSGSIYGELNHELQDAQSGRTRVGGLRQRLQTLSTRIEVEYELTHTALSTMASSLDGNFPDKKSQDDYATKLRQAASALDWVESTHLNGTASSVAGRPGPPGPGGEGLLQLVDKWNIDPTKEQAIFELIVNYINNVEMPILQAFQSQTFPATSQPLDARMQAHEATVFKQQQDERDNTPNAIDHDIQNMQTFYNTKIALATTKQHDRDEPTATDQLGLAGSGTVSAPVFTPAEADGTAGVGYSDTIRLKHPLEAFDANKPLSFDIDPLNPQTPEHDGLAGPDGQVQHWDDATIWYPNQSLPIGAATFTVQCNIPGGWGHLWAMPIERYLNDRIWRDQASLRQDYMFAMDQERNNNPGRPDLKRQILTMQNLLPNPDITTLPRTVVDDTANAQKGFDAIPVLPRLTNPPNALAEFNSQVTIYNTHSQAYLNEVRQLRNLLLTYGSIYEEFYISFAAHFWDNAVNGARDTVMGANPGIPGLAQNGTFMILSTYKLRRTIPSWAIDGMREAVREQVMEHIIEMNVVPLTRMLAGNATGTAVRPFADEAMADLQSTAEQAAGEIADEWVNRPWPYEIAPPTDPNDPDARPATIPIGIPIADRQNFFSALAWAADNDSPHILFPTIFGNSVSLGAYAQGEAFNWMEFNAGYGGNEQFDNPSSRSYGPIDSSGTTFPQIGCPRGWRLCSVGGWNWQPRLSVSDNLLNAMKANPDWSEGLNPAEQSALDAINLH